MADELSDSRLSAFLHALDRRAANPADALPDLSAVRQIAHAAELPQVFARHATESGMSVRSCRRAGLSELLLAELGAASITDAILGADESTPLASDLYSAVTALSNAGVRLITQPDDDTWFSTAASITTVAAAVAETGSLVVASGAATPRSSSLLPAVHVAIVAVSQIVPDLVDAFAALGARDLPAAVTLITGPSKTADIEGVLVTGVHGPGRVVIILVCDA